MSLKITQEVREGIEILTLDGELTFGQEDLDFRKELDRLVHAGKINAVLNLSRLSKLDTTGLGTLLFATEELRKAGGKLAVFNLKQSHIEMLVEARLETAMEVFRTEQDALASFFPDEEIKHYDILDLVESMKKQKPTSS
jgi:anti-sigma B factor antagonist